VFKQVYQTVLKRPFLQLLNYQKKKKTLNIDFAITKRTTSIIYSLMFHIFQNGGTPLSPTPLSLLSLYFQLKLTKHDSSIINKVTLLMLKYFDRLKIVWENASKNLAQEPVYAFRPVQGSTAGRFTQEPQSPCSGASIVYNGFRSHLTTLPHSIMNPQHPQ